MMAQEPVVIPEKIYFKIGEVCDLVGVQAHVLRYWETEFSMLSPQKNKSGQRSYRRRDVEIALRIKQLLYNEMFTIAGAKKKLQSEQREGSKPKAAAASPKLPEVSGGDVEAPTLFDTGVEPVRSAAAVSSEISHTDEQKDALKMLAANLLEIRDILKTSRI
ncbi:MAG: MerR family transcriptional regulator [Chloracidobacterium sp.]|nr:MerR family transcriptional regulator [Chloracidobacterium sp.]